jgi:hypothetical protein
VLNDGGLLSQSPIGRGLPNLLRSTTQNPRIDRIAYSCIRSTCSSSYHEKFSIYFDERSGFC